jgi:CRISPR-associated protein Csx17
MNTIALEGCTPEPLMNYLKALGILKIIVEQNFDATARGYWKDGIFYVQTELTEGDLIEAFLNRFQPSPALSPWNEAGGFKKKTGADAKTVQQASKSGQDRFLRIKHAVQETQRVVGTESKSKDKDDFILKLRNELPDDVIRWLDACGSYAADKYQFAPFLGTGGNVGKMEISINYLKNLTMVFLDKKHEESRLPWLRSCLFSTNEARCVHSSVSQFAPGQVGGANATQGTEGKSMINPWDFILMIEGSLLMTSASSRKLSTDRGSKSAFPFTVEASAAGNSKLAQSDMDNQKGKGEVWLPLWERPASLGELKILFSEGRAELKGRQARSGVDFARAVAGLGVDRGIKSFMRFSIVEFVKAGVMATPLGLFNVNAKNDATLLREIDSWLAAMKRSCNDKTPARFRGALREIEQCIFDFCQYGDNEGNGTRFQRILVGLGHAERIIASAPKFRADAKGLRPLGPLTSEWIAAADDRSPEFEIALALASLHHPEVGGIRLNLEDVEIRGRQISWTDKNHAAVWTGGDLSTNLAAVLCRRVMVADKAGKPSAALASAHRATLASVGEFCVGNLDENRITELLWALSLCDTRAYQRPARNHDGGERLILPASYRLLKLLFHAPGSWSTNIEENPIQPNLGILSLLRADRAPEACQRAVRLLRGKSLIAMPFAMRGFPARDSEWLDHSGFDDNQKTLAAALLIPITELGINALRDQVLRQKSDS